MELSRERAEAHLRLLAEAELRRAATDPAGRTAQAAAAALYGLPKRQREAIALQFYADLAEDDTARAVGLSRGAVRAHIAHGIAELRAALEAGTGRVAGIAQVLSTVRALDEEVAGQLMNDLALAAAVRPSGSAGRPGLDPVSLLRSPTAHVPLGMLLGAPPPAAAGTGATIGRVMPAGQMIPIRGEGEAITGGLAEVTGEMCVLSYARTASGARLTVAARTRGEFVPPHIEPSCRYRPYATFPVHDFTASDDQGTCYQVGFKGRGERRHSELTGQLTLDPGPPAGSRWLDLSTTPGEPAVRIDLNRPDGTELTIRPGHGPGEHLLEGVAMRLLLLALEFPEEIRLHPAVPRPEPFTCVADGLGDAVTALHACGALSPLSPVPGQLAALCASLNVTGHGIAAPPARDLPGPWRSLLTHYQRRTPRTAPDRDGCAAAGVALPELDGVRLAILGLHRAGDRTELLGLADGVPPDGYDGRLGRSPAFPLNVWIRDSGGRWHATRASSWTGEDRSEVTLRLRVVPPLSRADAWIDILAAGSSAQVLVTLSLRWQ